MPGELSGEGEDSRVVFSVEFLLETLVSAPCFSKSGMGATVAAGWFNMAISMEDITITQGAKFFGGEVARGRKYEMTTGRYIL